MGAGAFHRSILIEPGEGVCRAAVEDDFHHMRLALHHDGETVTRVDAELVRAPWSTCPGAEAVAEAAFTGKRLDEIAGLRGKRQNCTHLFDLAIWAAAHAGESDATRYDITVTDPVDGRRELVLKANTASAIRWIEEDKRFVSPPEIAGRSLWELGDWIATLDPISTEKTKALRWAAIVAHGRQIDLDQQSDATKIPANCYTFQPGRVEKASRVGAIKDFAKLPNGPLDGVVWPQS